VTRDVPPHAIVVGNPARITGYVEADLPDTAPPAPSGELLTESRVPRTRLVRLTRADDLRGSLVAGNFSGDLPFVPQRFFTVFDVPSTYVRGSHAHIACEQLLVCLKGSVRAVVDDGQVRQEFVLDRPDLGLYIGPQIWGTQYAYTPDAVLLVLASHPYDPADYIRDPEAFFGRTRGESPVPSS